MSCRSCFQTELFPYVTVWADRSPQKAPVLVRLTCFLHSWSGFCVKILLYFKALLRTVLNVSLTTIFRGVQLWRQLMRLLLLVYWLFSSLRSLFWAILGEHKYFCVLRSIAAIRAVLVPMKSWTSPVVATVGACGQSFEVGIAKESKFILFNSRYECTLGVLMCSMWLFYLFLALLYRTSLPGSDSTMANGWTQIACPWHYFPPRFQRAQHTRRRVVSVKALWWLIKILTQIF